MRVVSLLVAVLVLFVVYLSLLGCSLFEPKIKQHSTYYSIRCDEPPVIQPIHTATVRPRVVKDEYGLFWVGITPKDYENLSGNVQDSIRYIKEQKAISAYYKTCIIDFNRQIEAEQLKADETL